MSSDLLDATGSDAPGAPIEIRRLSLDDLQAVEAIERRSYQTPWSRSMFAGELAKATGLCLGAFSGDRLRAYLIVARYVDAWHVMNIAVDVDSRRRGIAERLLLELFAAHGSRRLARLHARGAGLERRRDPPLRAARVPRIGCPARVLHRQP